MRVWIVSSGEPLPIDGENTRLRRMGNLAKMMSSEGHSIVWFTTTYDRYNKKQHSTSDIKVDISQNYTLNLSYVKEFKKNVSIGRLLFQYKAANSIKKKFSTESTPDIIIATMAPVKLTNYVCKYGNKLHVPVVVDVRDLWPAFIKDMVRPYLKSAIVPYVKYHEIILSNMMKKAYAIIGVSSFFLEYGLKYAKRKRNNTDTVIPLGYPNYDYTKYIDKIDKYWDNLTSDDFIIACTGTFSRQFNYSAVIEASRILAEEKDIKFVLCGTGVQFKSIKNIIGSNVIMPGWVGKDHISSLLINSKAGLIPYIDSINYRENSTNKFGEYLSAHLPILVSVKGEMELLIEDYQCGYCYSNGRELANKILKYRNNKIFQQTHALNSRILYEKMFNGEKVTNELSKYLIMISDNYTKNENS